MTSHFAGILPVLATPFTLQEELDLPSLRRLIVHARSEGAHGLVALGLASETALLSEVERKSIIETLVASVNGGLPVIAGLQAASTAEAVRWARWLAEAGVAGLMVLPPPGPVDTSSLVKHYVALAEAAAIPLIVQDCPQVVGYGISVDALARMAEASANIQYVKLEAQPSAPLMNALKARLGDRLAMIVGWGGIGFIEAMQRGAVACMPGTYLLRPLVQIYERMCAGDIEGARGIYAAILPVLAGASQSLTMFIHAAKHLLARQGIIAHPTLRQPAMLMDERALAELDAWWEFAMRELSQEV